MANRTRTVLIVEKSPTLRYYFGMLLKRLEYTSLTSATPEEALRVLEHTVPSLVLTDVVFPTMSGIEFLKKLKSSERTRGVPVIVLTDEQAEDQRSASFTAGCAAYLDKQVDPGHLYRVIQKASEPVPRSNIRINTSLRAVVGDEREAGVKASAGYASMISEGGLYVRTLAQRPERETMQVTITIRDREIRAKAVVLYSRSLEGGAFQEPGMGLKFVEISEGDREFLRTFIQEQLTADIKPGK